MRGFRQEMDLPTANRIDPREVSDGGHLIDKLAHDLVFGRHWLGAALVVELAAVVVGGVVAGGHVEAAVGLEEPDGER